MKYAPASPNVENACSHCGGGEDGFMRYTTDHGHEMGYSVRRIAELLHVSEWTVRDDLHALEHQT